MNNKKFYTYNVFGLILKSELELKELIASKEEVHQIILQLKSAKHPFNQFKKKGNEIMYKQNAENFCLRLPDTGDFMVSKKDDKTKIIMEVKDAQKLHILKSWLFGTVLNAVLIMNKKFALHASAISLNGKGILFSGKSGIGKSTLATQFHTKGYPIYSDDKCVLERSLKSNKYQLMPSLAITRLWDNSIELLDDQTFYFRTGKNCSKRREVSIFIRPKKHH